MTSDCHARTRVREDLGTTTVVVAGAGTGKTTALVERIAQIVRSGRGRLKEIVAITFSEAAAHELRQRIRHAMREAVEADPSDRVVRRALEEVDDATVSTLHSFAERILLEHCAAAGLPPGFEVLDDTADACDFDARWDTFADSLFEDEHAEPYLMRGLLTGLRHGDLKSLARALHCEWDRLEDLEPDRWPRSQVACHRVVGIDATEVIAHLDTALALAGSCHNEDDNLLAHLRDVATIARDALCEAEGDEEETLLMLFHLPPLRCSQGRQENWSGRISEVREACADAERARTALLDEVRIEVLSALLPRLVAFVLEAAGARRREGRLNFHDLLVDARRLLRCGGESIAATRRRYRWILMDEFQDTDPLQVELAARLVAGTEGSDALSSARPGALFVVGDPKQSIYRFRRADIALFERVSEEIGERLVLQRNFRSVPGIIDFVNCVFAGLFGTEPSDGQAAHHPLEAARDAIEAVPSRPPDPAIRRTSNHRRNETRTNVRRSTAKSPAARVESHQLELPWEDGPYAEVRDAPADEGEAGPVPRELSPYPPVLTIGTHMAGSAPDVRRQSATDVARCVLQMVGESWTVAGDGPSSGTGDPSSRKCDGRRVDSPRPARFGDVAVLIPTRASLPPLEEAFDEAGVPYRLEGASLLWGSEEVRDVLAVLRVAADPADEVAVLGALRSPGLACGDDDLLDWHKGGGGWEPRRSPPDGLERHPVARAMRVLTDLHSARWWCEPSQLVARAFEELRSFELAFAHPRPRDHWQRLRWLADQARLFDETIGGGLRSFLSWADLQAQGDGRATGIGPPDPDDDAVRVMTVHGSKGLEFPVVFVCGLERQDSECHRPKPVLWGEGGRLEVRAGPLFRTDGYEVADLCDQDLDALERVRLLHVAMTRARDHLVVCLHHREHSGTCDSSLAASLFALCSQRPDLCRQAEGIPQPARTECPGHEIAYFGHGGTRIGTNGTRHAGDLGGPHGTSRARGAHGVRGASDADGARDSDGAREADNAIGADRASDSDGAESDMDEQDDWQSFCAEWTARRQTMLEKLRRRPVVSATPLAEDRLEGGAPSKSRSFGAVRAELAGNYDDVALRIGRAVHSVLATVDLGAPADAGEQDVGALCRARAIAAGIGWHAQSVTTMVERALSSSVIRSAADRRHWRELYVATPVACRTPAHSHATVLLEGIVDLSFEDDEGWVVVDYKTDQIASPVQLSEAVERHSVQLAAYAAALERSTGRPVVRGVLVFLAQDPPIEYGLEGDELAAKMRSSLERVAASLAL